jgi:hypothetical protein
MGRLEVMRMERFSSAFEKYGVRFLSAHEVAERMPLFSAALDTRAQGLLGPQVLSSAARPALIRGA